MEYYSAIKKNEIMSLAATWMDLKIIILGEVGQRKTISYEMTNVKSNKKNDTKELMHNVETNTKILKSNLWLPRWEPGWEG